MEGETKSSTQTANTMDKTATSSNHVHRERSSKSYREMSYREKPATPNSPSGSSVTTMYDHLLSPPSPEDEEKDDRLRNDLLDEICNDMGIDDSMDLDFDDFCYQPTQQSGKAGSRFPSGSASSRSEADARRSSVSTTTSGYTTSDSLCAIAKLTQSITSETGPNVQQPADGIVKQEEVAQEDSEPLVVVKQENQIDISEQDSSEMVSTGSEQGKVAATKMIQRQRSECNPYTVPASGQSPSSVMKRRRSVHEETPITEQSQDTSPTCSGNADSSYQQQITQPMSSTAAPTWPPPSYTQQRNATCDYSYSDDFTMEDMTAPDTMINFSEMPQQPNYYQMPQSAGDNLNLNFTMSLSSQGYPPTGQSTSAPTNAQSQFGRMQCGNMQQSQTTQMNSMTQASATMSSQGQQMRAAQAGQFQSPSQMQSSTSQFPYQQHSGATPSTSASMQSVYRQDSFPNGASVPQSPSGHLSGQSTGFQQPPSQAPAQKPTGPSANYNSSQQGFMQRLVTDKSSAFRSHPLFPLLRDLIIADMNFQEPTFPHQLIRDLPADFNKLLKNYLSRNPPRGNYHTNPSVESVVMDALKYAHHTLIEKIQQKKASEEQSQGQQPQNQGQQVPSTATSHNMAPPAMSDVNEYCDKFEDSVRQSMAQQSQHNYGRAQMNIQHSPSAAFKPPNSRMRTPGVYSNEMSMQGTYNQPLTVDTGCSNSPSAQPAHSTGLVNQMGPPPPPGMSHQTGMYPSQPPQYPPQNMQTGYNRMSQSGARNHYMNQAPTCPPPNYTVSPNNPPIPRQHQSMYDMPMYGHLHDPSNPYDPAYNNCMTPPNHNPRMHSMGERQLMYMNNINDGSLVKTMMEGGKEGFGDNMSDNSSVISGHSMQGSVKGGPNQGKTTEGRKHASLPKEAVNIMLTWLREHQDKPYPNDDEKGMLIKQTGLSITQINYWFTNARRRLLPKWRGEDM